MIRRRINRENPVGELLQTGQTLRTDSGSTCQVGRFLGGGGQGEVYQADWSGKPFALKWYFPQTADAKQLNALQALVKKGPPSDKFLWPIEMISVSGQPGFGYLMPLREPRHRSMIDMIRRRVEPSFKALATAGLHLADSFLKLHAKGMCYCDISWGNVFLDPSTGDIAICDNDNVIVNGQPPAILGTPDFMAPEVVRQEVLPSTETDKFSLAVMLFYLLFVDHPLKGKKDATIHCFDLDARVKLFGKEPVYIFDPNNASNRPVPGIHDNAIAFEKVYPTFLKKLFEKAFTTGLHDPQHGRVTENEWKASMVQLRDAIIYCHHCNAENVYDPEYLQNAGGTPAPC
jgi:DNA-binding helix-hairpin-helix protein with protein kinase domain